MKSITSDTELARLLEIAEKPASPLDDPKLNDTERFVIAKGLKEGPAKIYSFYVWDLYIQWAKKPLAKNQFFIYFNSLFRQFKANDVLFYRLEASPFDLSRDYYFALRRRMRDARTRSARKKDKKKPAEVSGT